MPYTKDELIVKIKAIDVKLDALVESDVISYSVGSVSMSKIQYAEFLEKRRAVYVDMLKGVSTEDVSAVDYGISRFGEDDSKYLGDEY
jgi:hypothetical protein